MKRKLLCFLLSAALLMSLAGTAVPQAKAQNDLRTSDDLVNLLKQFEGFAKYQVWDNSQWSVGYGTRVNVCALGYGKCPGYPNCTDENCEFGRWVEGNPISEEDATRKMREFLTAFEGEINRFAKKHGLTFSQQQFDALVSFTYNCGGGWMLESYDPEGNFRNAVISGDMGDLIVYTFGLWSKSGKTVSLGHIRRRMIEAQIYVDGVYSSYDEWPENYRYVFLDGNGGETRYAYQTFHAALKCPFRAEFTAVPKDASGNDLTFAGWFTKPEGGVEVKELSGALTNGLILYAHWKNAAGETVTINTDTSTAADVTVIVPQWWPNTLYEGPGTYYSEVRKTTLNEQLHITKTVVGKDGDSWGYCADGWIPLKNTNYSDVVNATYDGAVWYLITASDLNVRTGPGTNYGTIGVQKQSGEQALILETQESADQLQTWAKMSDGNWICIRNGESIWAVVMDPQPEIPKPKPVTGVTVSSITITSVPDVREYALQGPDVLPDLTGGKLSVKYSDGSNKTISITRAMVSGFDNSTLGTNTITVTCGGKTADYTIQIVPTNITGITIQSMPAKTEYVQGDGALDLTGAAIRIHYDKGDPRTVPVTADMVSSFDGLALGINTLTVTYQGYSCTFDVTVVKPTVTFHNYDGTVLSQTQYAIGEAVIPPTVPTRPADAIHEYLFVGWDKEVTACNGNAVYTAVFEEITVKFPVTFLNYNGAVLSQSYYAVGETVTVPADPVKPADAEGEYVFAGWDQEIAACAGQTTYTAVFRLRYAVGDLDRNDQVNEADAIYLLRHVLFPEKYPVYARTDIDKDGTTSEADAIYLLRHILFPDKYPL